MKHSALALASVSSLCAALLSATDAVAAEDPQSPEIVPIQPASQAQEAPKPAVPSNLNNGVDEVVKMTHAQISEDVIATYIQASGSVYNLKPTDIVNLHQQGVSDRIVTLMLAQGHLAAPSTNPPVMVMAPPIEPPVMAPAPVAPAPDQNRLFIPGDNAFDIAAAGAPVTYEPASTVYVIPDNTRSGIGYHPVYTCYSSFYNSYGCVSPVIRIGGGGSYHHRYYSFHRR